MHLIVGVDTGKTIGYACMGLDGKLIASDHASSAGVEWLVSEIERLGTPSVISCDKLPNDIVRKVAAAFNAKIFYPDREMSIDDKMRIARPFGISNPHERDACAAAVKAYNSYANKLKQAEHAAKENNFNDIDSLKAKVIAKYSIDEVFSEREIHRR